MLMKTIKYQSVGIFTFLIFFTLTTVAKSQNMMHTPLTEPGNDIFGTIQETVSALEADSSTNWDKVNLEALRRHLLDMKAFTEEVDVLKKEPIDGGVKFQVHPRTKRAKGALKRLFAMHPSMLKKEKGWDMKAQLQNNGNWEVSCITSSPAEVAKIRGLGYIGLIAEGAHHQLHHWMIATGRMKYPK